MSKVYLAAPFSDIDRQRELAYRFMAKGHEITSSWVFGGEEGLNYTQIAIKDLGDVDKSNVLVLKTILRGEVNTNGRVFEFGYAYAKGIKCFLVGPHENVFCELPNVIKVNNYDEVMVLI